MQLIPSQSFAIVRQLDNVNDTTTYYVQAVVRNANNDTILATVNLTSKGNQRFVKVYQVPADTSGLGYYLSIVTSVYTDSGYSQLSQVYATEEHTYLVIQPAISTYGNGGTTYVDYDKIKKMILDGIKFPGIPTYDKDFKGIQKSTNERFDEIKGHFEKTVKSIQFPRYDDTGLRQSVVSLQEELRTSQTRHESAMKAMSMAHSQDIANLRSHHESVVRLMDEKLSKIADRPYVAEKERDGYLDQLKNLTRDHESVLGVIKTIQATNKYGSAEEDTKNSIDKRVKKLIGI